MSAAIRNVQGLRVEEDAEHTHVHSRDEAIVVEEPLEIRVAGDPVATTMRSPGEDHYLALGFLVSEGVITSADAVGSVYPCGQPQESGFRNVIDVIPHSHARVDVDRLIRSHRVASPNTACGVCGRDGIDDLLQRIARLPVVPRSLSPALIARIPMLLHAHQPAFARTGGLHAACAVTADGIVRAHAEDVGRHNAVDKVVGKLLCGPGLPRADQPMLLGVSGRASFEVVQKAAAAGFCAVASVSAPSSLAVDTAEAAGLTLAAFVREGRFTLYTHRDRVGVGREVLG